MRLLLASLLLATPLLAIAAQDETDLEKGRMVVQSLCTRCHDSGRICLNLERDQPWWADTVARMRRNGAPLRPGQAEQAALYLSSLKPGSKPVCP